MQHQFTLNPIFYFWTQTLTFFQWNYPPFTSPTSAILQAWLIKTLHFSNQGWAYDTVRVKEIQSRLLWDCWRKTPSLFCWKDVKTVASSIPLKTRKKKQSRKQVKDPRRNQVLMQWHYLNSWIQLPMEFFSTLAIYIPVFVKANLTCGFCHNQKRPVDL